MSFISKSLVALLISTASLAANAAPLTCLFPILGDRTMSFDDAAACTLAGVFTGGGIGDNTVAGYVPGSTLIDRDPGHADADETALQITGVGASSGTWATNASTWANYANLYLFFHFGNAGDTRPNNPDWFIVQLTSNDLNGTWDFSDKNGLSNVALLGSGTRQQVPEPNSLVLAALALIGLGFGLRRHRKQR